MGEETLKIEIIIPKPEGDSRGLGGGGTSGCSKMKDNEDLCHILCL